MRAFHRAQESLVEAHSMMLRPGVMVQERLGDPGSTSPSASQQRLELGGHGSTVSNTGSGSAAKSQLSEPSTTSAHSQSEVVVRCRSGPVELQVPGRLSRSAYKVRQSRQCAG